MNQEAGVQSKWGSPWLVEPAGRVTFAAELVSGPSRGRARALDGKNKLTVISVDSIVGGSHLDIS